MSRLTKVGGSAARPARYSARNRSLSTSTVAAKANGSTWE